MKNLITAMILMVITSISINAQCVDISTQDVVNYLNREIKPSLDLKLDKDDGFLAIKGKRQNLQLPEVDYQMRKYNRTWKYSFHNVRRVDSNFFYDSNKNLFALDVKFESDDSEIKGRCPDCIKPSRDSRAPDINWTSTQILRIYLKPTVYDNSVSFLVDDMKFIGEFEANGLGVAMLSLVDKSLRELKTELQKVFQNGQTQRLFNDALRPLLINKNVRTVRSVSLASSSLRTCR
jgi:hypothetical protein